MAATPRFKIYNAGGEYVAACEYAEESACLVALLGEGAEIRDGHKDVVWREGHEEQSAAQSYDFVAETIWKRIEKLWHAEKA